jgi:integrase
LDLIPKNVALKVKPPVVERRHADVIDVKQAGKLLTALKGDRLEALYSVAIAVGLRRGEALGLRWSDVDLKAGTVTVRNQLQRVHGELKLAEPKTSQARRVVDLPAFALEVMKAHRLRQGADREDAGERWKEMGYVFTTSIGTPIEPGNVSRHFAAVLKRAKLPPMRFHDLRHTCATLMLVQGTHPRAVMEILGHSRISLTMDTYSHVLPSVKREAAELMDGLLGAKPKRTAKRGSAKG